MAQEYAKRFYKSKAWQSCRTAYIGKRRMIDGGMCEVCGERIGYIVHHTITLTPSNIKNPDVSLNHEHLRYECKECHDLEPGHYYDAKGIKKLVAGFDADGNPIDRRSIAPQ